MANYPTAVSPSQLTPGLYLTIDLLAGPASAGSGELKVALLAPKSAAGDLTPDTEVRPGGGEDSASDAFGPGTQGHLAAKLLYSKFPAAQIDFVAPVAGAGLATLDIVAAGAPASNNVADVDIHGRQFEVPWLVGETPDNFRDNLIAAINQRTDDLAVVASNGGAGTTQVDGKVAGNWGNDVLVRARLRFGTTGTETLTGAAVHTPLAGGTTDPDLTNALAAIAGEEYHFIMPCLSNTDVANVATTNNLKRCRTHIDQFDQGLNAKLQQVVAGFTGSLAQATATTLDSDSLGNVEFGQLLLCIAGRSLPCEFGAREAGGRLAAESLDPAANRIGEQLDGVVGAFDKIANKPTLTQSETALGNGVSLVSYDAQGNEVLVRPVTTHSRTSTGAPDRRLLDVQNVSATYIVARDVRTQLPQEFPNAKITPDTPEGEEPPPQGVIEERDIKAFVISLLRFWVKEAVLTKASVDAAIADGTLIVKVNDVDSTQVDLVIPFSIVPPLAKFGAVVQRVPN